MSILYNEIPVSKVPNQHSFKGNYAFLSNMYKAPIKMSLEFVTPEKREYFQKYFIFDDCIYPATENLYQALKDRFLDGRYDFRYINPFAAKMRGKLISKGNMRFGWSQDRLIAMELVIDLKFNQHPNLFNRLLNTPDEDLVEWNTWGDIFWGKCIKTGKGTNHLGEILKRKKYQLLGKPFPGENIPTIIKPNEMSNYGILWAINKFFLHPLGLALARDRDEDIITGCVVAPDGKWEFPEKSNAENKIKFRDFLKTIKKEYFYERIIFTREDLEKLDEIQNVVLGECDGSRSVGYKSDRQIYELCLELLDRLFRECIVSAALKLDIEKRIEYNACIHRVLKSYSQIINDKL